MKFESLRGFRDIYPDDGEAREKMFVTAKKIAHSFGYEIIDFPSLEPLDLYRLKSGDELVNQTFSFVDRGGREVTMIPEATPSVVRMLTAKKDIPKPVRWFSLPKIWRYEEPQSGRTREHVQFNADMFGQDSPEADSEIIGLACSILDSLGLSGEYEIRLNHRGLMEKILSAMAVPDIPAAFGVIDRFRKMDRETFLSTLTGLGISEASASSIEKMAETRLKSDDLKPFLSKIMAVDDNLLEILERIIKTMQEISQYTQSGVVLDFSIVRGLSYYTGIVFEAFDIKGQLRAILGGGRYNGLSALLSDQTIPAVGFGMGDVVLELLMKRKGLWTKGEDEHKYYICTVAPEASHTALDITIAIRKKGFTAIRDLGSRGLSAQLRSAAVAECNHAVIIGKAEMEMGTVTVRDMKTGDQRSIKVDQFLDSICKSQS